MNVSLAAVIRDVAARRGGPRIRRAALLAVAACVTVPLLASGAATNTAPPVPYPTGYRHWMHVKSMVIGPGHPLYDAFGGIHHLYGNAKAIDGYRTGRFADGAVIVFDLLEAKQADHAITEGPRKVVGVMTRNAARYASTGGWGFEAFKGDGTERAVGGNAASACFECHRSQQGHQYVFSALRP